MTDFLTRMTQQAAAPIARPVTILGETDTVYFRLLTAGQRLALVSGEKFQVKKGDSPVITVDLGENETHKHKMVQFCVCDEKGQPVFKDVASVKALPAPVLEALNEAAQAVNREAFGEADAPGES